MLVILVFFIFKFSSEVLKAYGFCLLVEHKMAGGP